MYTVSLRAARVNMDMTQDDAARALGKTKQTIVNWETGKTDIKYRDLLEISNLYHVPIDRLRLK